MDYFLNVLAGFFFTIGVGVILHFYAFMVAWGFKKGLAKVVSTTTWNVGIISVKLIKE